MAAARQCRKPNTANGEPTGINRSKNHKTMNITKLLSTLALATLALTAGAQQKYVGGDISLLTQYENHGAKYYDYDGTTPITDLLTYFKSQGLNAMRVRLFVDPSKAPSSEIGQGVCQDFDYVKTLGKRIKDAGFAFMLDFHYSDSWADPAKQYTPSAWESLSNDELYTKIYDYTKESLQTLTAAGATPDMIQIGNEISYGMLWGKRSTGSLKYYAGGGSSDAVNTRFYTLLKNASKACREQCPDAKIIIHTERVPNTSYLSSFYKNMDAQGIDYDIIGLSYYPYYHGYLPQLEKALSLMQSEHSDKRIMIVETGFYHAYQPSDVTYDYSSTYPITETGQKAFTEALVETLKNYEQVDGLFWWSMESNEKGLDWNTKRVTDNWYNASLFDNNTGKAMSALSVLQDFAKGSAGIPVVNAETNDRAQTVFSLDGRAVSKDGTNGLPKGLYLQSGRKVIVK